MTAIKILVTAATMIPFEINIRENRGTGQRQIKQKHKSQTKHNKQHGPHTKVNQGAH
jgi:hypothetical protein